LATRIFFIDIIDVFARRRLCTSESYCAMMVVTFEELEYHCCKVRGTVLASYKVCFGPR